MFEAGDIVESTVSCYGAVKGEKYEVWMAAPNNPRIGGTHNPCSCKGQWKLIKKFNESSPKNMNILEKFVTSMKSEPEKTFYKAGITDKDNMLTADGTKIFLTYLLKEHGEDFKKNVVDALVADEKK